MLGHHSAEVGIDLFARHSAVLDDIVQQSGNGLVDRAAVLEHEAGDVQQVTHIGNGRALARLAAMAFGGIGERAAEAHGVGGQDDGIRQLLSRHSLLFPAPTAAPCDDRLCVSIVVTSSMSAVDSPAPGTIPAPIGRDRDGEERTNGPPGSRRAEGARAVLRRRDAHGPSALGAARAAARLELRGDHRRARDLRADAAALPRGLPARVGRRAGAPADRGDLTRRAAAGAPGRCGAAAGLDRLPGAVVLLRARRSSSSSTAR